MKTSLLLLTAIMTVCVSSTASAMDPTYVEVLRAEKALEDFKRDYEERGYISPDGDKCVPDGLFGLFSLCSNELYEDLSKAHEADHYPQMMRENQKLINEVKILKEVFGYTEPTPSEEKK